MDIPTVSVEVPAIATSPEVGGAGFDAPAEHQVAPVPILETPDGSRYFTQEAANAALVEKARYIAKLESMLEGNRAPAPVAQPQANPAGERQSYVESRLPTLIHQGWDEATAKAMAGNEFELRRGIIEDARKEAHGVFREQQRASNNAEYESIKAMDPRFDLNDPDWGDWVAGIAVNNRGESPRMHYQRFIQKLEKIGQANGGRQVTQYAQGGTPQRPPQPMYPTSPGGGAPLSTAYAPVDPQPVIQAASSIKDRAVRLGKPMTDAEALSRARATFNQLLASNQATAQSGF